MYFAFLSESTHSLSAKSLDHIVKTVRYVNFIRGNKDLKHSPFMIQQVGIRIFSGKCQVPCDPTCLCDYVNGMLLIIASEASIKNVSQGPSAIFPKNEHLRIKHPKLN